MNLWLIPTLPLLGFLINGLFGRRFPKALVNLVAIGSVTLSFLWVVKTLLALSPLETTAIDHYYTWIQSGAFNVGLDFAVDRLTAVMLMIVTGVGLLIHIYSIGYMEHEHGYYRFFAYLNLFMFFMLVLVLARNFLVLFVGWEGVGLCSYLLIGFYFTEKFATDAGNKAFIVNRIGDFGFSLAMFLIVKYFGSLDFGVVFGKAQNLTSETVPFFVICMLLLLGACGKSAQIPLYVWLPDAMAGPTPVSALIHAATMVTAGVYMVARSSVLFAHAPLAMDWVAAIGTATAFFAATIGLAQTDIKKVFAYSTVSQLGYMFMGVGVGAYSAGIFHLMTHAFFKALLFLGAGSVIHALSGEQDLRKMGGLARKIPITCVVLFCAGVAIAGLPFTSGAASKDLILEAAYQRSPILYWIGVITAGMTAFYVFRALFLTFFGKYRGDAHHIHEAPFVMWGPLAILAALSLAGGLINIPRWLEPMFPLHEAEIEPLIRYLPFAAGILGIGIAYIFYVLKPAIPEALASDLGGLYKLIYNKYFVDELYDVTVVEPVVQGSKTVLWRGIDVGLIDGIVNGIGRRSRGIGNILRLLQSGNIRNYATWVVFGSVILLIAIGLAGRCAMNLLNFVITIPLLGFLIGIMLPKANIGAIRIFALGISILVFIASLGLIGPFWYNSPTGYQFETNSAWIDFPPIRYHVGIDGLSLWLVILTTLLTPLCVLISWKYIDKRQKEFYAFLLLLEFGLVGVFCAVDLFLFYVFWELALVPMYFLIGIWGYSRRIYAAIKFFLYTMTGSVLMLVAIIYMYNRSGTFDYQEILGMLQSGRLVLSPVESLWLFLAFFFAFAIKVPLFPLHTWLPDAHVEAPTAGSVMLASVMLKMGTYGILRFSVPMFPSSARACAVWIVPLAIIGIIYGALVAMVQPNMKKLVAYSSVSHLGFVVLGIFSFTQTGFDGAVYQMLNHGVSTGALFMLVGFLYERRHSLEISAYGGVGTPAPNLAKVFMITMLASIGLPTLNNFVGEYLVLQGAALTNFKWAIFAAIGVILSAVYMLWLYQRTFLGKTSEDVVHHLYDLVGREYCAIVPLIVLMVWMGIFTQSFMPPITATNARILGPIESKREIQVKLEHRLSASVKEVLHAR